MNEQAKVDLIRHVYQSYTERDIPRLLSYMTDDIKWELPVIEGIPFTGKRSGRDEVEKFFRLVDHLQEVRKFHPLEFVAQGDKVIVMGHYEWLVKATGSTFACDWVHVFGLAGHHIDTFREYTDTNRIARAYQP
jgi:ketosteroid isomerase-like protein